MAFDLAAYLERIRLPARPTIDHHGLAALQRAHRLAIPFENLDIALGRGIAIDPEAVFAKLVTARRGGYCFEHNQLLQSALATLGFDARPLLGRVWLGASDTPPRNHAISLVTIDGQQWLADAGFGGSYTPPLPLVDGATADAPDGARFHLARDTTYGWLLTREGPAGTTDGRGAAQGPQWQYSFTTDEVWSSDLAVSNHWTSTAPGTRFTTLRIASIVLPRGFASLTDRHYSRHVGDEHNVGQISDPRVYRMRLALMFGIELDAAEIATLGLF